jgi:succinoglycan biosynthesis transport protein ExoP
LDLSDFLRILRKRWIGIAASALLGLAAAAGVTIFTTPMYEASTLVFVQVQSSGTVGELVQGGSFVQSQVKSYAEVVSQPRVLDSVVQSLSLDESASELAQSVSATAPLDTVNIEITVTRDSPTEAAEIADAVTASFRTTIGEITISAAGAAAESQVLVSVLRDASVPTQPISPNTNLNLALGLLLGLAAGIGYAMLRDLLDTRIRGERDVKAITTAPIIGAISFDSGAVARPLIVQDDPRSVRAEAFRTLRTNLQFLDIESSARSFSVTSSVPSEGKTTTAVNLAIAIADSGAQVVIIDGDLRRPKVADYMGVEGAVGLTDVLIARASLEDALQPWGRGNLTVLPAGTIPPNPSELLGSRTMASVLRTLEAEFDVVIIDLPPLLPVTDAAIVSKLTAGSLVVVAAGRTRKPELAGAIDSLEGVDAHIAGVILTMLPTRGPDAYGYGRYGYGGYGYAAAEPNNSASVEVSSEGARRRISPNVGRGTSTP